VTNEPDFADQLALYTAKMRMENDPMWRVGVQAYEQQMKADAVRMAIAGLEESRWQFSQVIAPFLPEIENGAPVALQSAPAQSFNVNSHHDDLYPDFVEEPFKKPRFMHEEPQHYVGRNGE
jgi:hypothetical protein